MILNDEKGNKCGRPTKLAQLELQDKVRPYFERGISAFATAKETGINVKTVNKYFEKWYSEIKDSQKQEFIERTKFEKERAVLAIENQLLQSYKIQDDLEKQMPVKSGKARNAFEKGYYKLRMQIVGTIVNLISMKINLANAVTADASLEQKTKELIKENGFS
jgi:hypothetical protein